MSMRTKVCNYNVRLNWKDNPPWHYIRIHEDFHSLDEE